jgi:hypothetical protein
MLWYKGIIVIEKKTKKKYTIRKNKVKNQGIIKKRKGKLKR